MSEPAKKSQRWLEVFTEFIKLLRIDSKEVAAIDEKGSPLNLWGSQKRFLEGVCEGLDAGIRTFYCLKSRQVGLTTLSLVFDVFWLAIYPATIGALVTNNPKNSAANRRAIRRYIQSIPKGFFGKSFSIVDDNKDFITFSNGSRLDLLVAGKRSKSWGEGVGYVFCHCTEVSDYGNKEGLDSFRESLASNHPNRLFIFESTAKGFNFWRDMWIAAKKDVHTSKCIFVGWWSKELNTIPIKDARFASYSSDPTGEEKELMDAVEEQYGCKIKLTQLAWYRWRAAQDDVDASTLHQNQPWTEGQAFVMSGFSFFAVRVLQKDMERILDPEDPITFKGYRYLLGNDFQAGIMEPINDAERIDEVRLRVWEDPVPGAKYAIGCDPAWGRNDWKDRTAIEVYRCFADKLIQVAEYADSDVDTRQAAWVLAHLAGAYKDCAINIELTGGPGRAVMTELDHLRERLRSDMYREGLKKDFDWDDYLQTARWYLYHKPDSLSAGYAKGWDSTGSSKWELMCQIKDSHTSGMLVLRSVPLVEEMMIVVQNGSEIGAPGRSKDDRMFASALSNRCWLDGIRRDMIAQGLSYEVCMRMRDEDGQSKGAAFVDQIVMRFMQNQENREEPLTPRQQWLADRGFVD
jgi:hypothetical protein